MLHISVLRPTLPVSSAHKLLRLSVPELTILPYPLPGVLPHRVHLHIQVQTLPDVSCHLHYYLALKFHAYIIYLSIFFSFLCIINFL